MQQCKRLQSAAYRQKQCLCQPSYVRGRNTQELKDMSYLTFCLAPLFFQQTIQDHINTANIHPASRENPPEEQIPPRYSQGQRQMLDKAAGLLQGDRSPGVKHPIRESCWAAACKVPLPTIPSPAHHPSHCHLCALEGPIWTWRFPKHPGWLHSGHQSIVTRHLLAKKFPVTSTQLNQKCATTPLKGFFFFFPRHFANSYEALALANNP